MPRVPFPNPKPGSNSWPFDMSNPTSARQAAAAQEDRVRAQQGARSANWADDQAYRDRISQARQSEANFARDQKLFEQRAARMATQYKMPIEQARQAIDPDNQFGGARTRAVQSPKGNALQRMLSRLKGGPGALGALTMIPMLLEGGKVLTGTSDLLRNPELEQIN